MEESLKQLLLKDLCARLPYGVMVLEDIDKEFDGGCVSKLDTITEIKGEKMFLTKNSLTPVTIEEIRPYLRPISSMTEDDIKELSKIDKKRLIFSSRHLTYHLDGKIIDYLNRKMFDYRGLIPTGLALEVPNGMYDLEKK